MDDFASEIPPCSNLARSLYSEMLGADAVALGFGCLLAAGFFAMAWNANKSRIKLVISAAKGERLSVIDLPLFWHDDFMAAFLTTSASALPNAQADSRRKRLVVVFADPRGH